MFEAIADTFAWFIKAPFICCGWIIVGVIAGDIARRLMGSKDQGFIADFILGIGGAIIGGIITGLLGLYRPESGLTGIIVTLIIAIVGAAVLIAIGRAISGGRGQVKK